MTTEISEVLTDLASRYRVGPAVDRHESINRQTFQVELATSLVPGGSLVDIGGGLSLFSAACVAQGMEATLVDDFGDPNNDAYGEAPLEFIRNSGVRVLSRDVIADGLELGAGTVDLVSCFDSMEHWHNSPKALFAEVVETLKPGGWFVLGVPNCVNLRKRITVPFGNGKWSQMEDWYERPVFRAHVREPDVGDLEYVARDMGLSEVRILGRNWLGYRSRYAWVRVLIPFADRLLQLRPTLCSDIYLVGRRPLQP